MRQIEPKKTVKCVACGLETPHLTVTSVEEVGQILRMAGWVATPLAVCPACRHPRFATRRDPKADARSKGAPAKP